MSELATSLGPLFSAVTTGARGLGSILGMIQQGQQYSKLNAFEKMTPQQLAAKVAAGTQPLNAGLVQNVTNSVQGADAERGLATSPGIFNADLSQSLAPYVQQNQNTALQLLMAKMGLPVQAASLIPRGGSGANSWANLLSLFPSGSGAPTSPNAAAPFMDYNSFLFGNPSTPPDLGLTDSPVFASSGATS